MTEPATICNVCKYKNTCPGYGTRHALDCEHLVRGFPATTHQRRRPPTWTRAAAVYHEQDIRY